MENLLNRIQHNSTVVVIGAGASGVSANMNPKIRAKTVLASLCQVSEREINIYDMFGNVDPQRTCGNMWMVSPTGIEPVTISLKGRCSTY